MMGKFQQKYITDDASKIDAPEKDLWIAVLTRAVIDACKGPPALDMTRQANICHQSHYKYNRDQARHFFLQGGFHFRQICEMAGRDPTYVQQKIRKIILRNKGWNVDVPITSHYRQGPQRKRGRPRGEKYRKTHPAGNTYYKAKREKNMRAVLRGSKGGRPRLYVV